MRSFPSIKQFRHVVAAVVAKATYVGKSDTGEAVFDNSLPKPTLTFKGTIKLHGTNGGVVIDAATGSIFSQSKERILTLEEDNHGFCAWVQAAAPSGVFDSFLKVAESFSQSVSFQTVHVFGERVGKSINAKTGIGQLSDRFVVFAVLGTDASEKEHWLDMEAVASTFKERNIPLPADIHFIDEFPQLSITIDFNKPEEALEKLEQLTLAVEAECPAAKALGGSGIGEGIVWVCEDPTFGRLTFKTKGEQHVGTKSMKLVGIAPEKLANQDAFISAVLTESRLEQGFELIRATHGTVTADHVGEFLKWIGTDVLKEESDTLEASGLKRTDVMSSLNRRAKAWLTPRLVKV